jgi:MFS family permease
MVSLAMPLLALRYGLRPAELGLVVAAAAIPPLLLAVPLGQLADRWGARRVLLLGFAGTALVVVPMAIRPSLPALIVAYVGVSALQNALIVGAQSLIAALGQAGRSREAAYGAWTTAMSAGQILGPLAAGFLLDSVGVRSAFVVVAAVHAAALAVMTPTREAPRVDAGAPPMRLREGVGLLRDRRIGMAVLTSTAAVWAMTIQQAYLPAMLEALAWSATTIGLVISIRSVAAVILRPILPQVVAALGGRERTVVLTLIALAAGLVGVAIDPRFWVVAAFVALFGAGHGLSQPVSMVMVVDRVAPAQRGAVLGMRLMLNRVAQLLAPLAFTALASGPLARLFFAHAALIAATTALLLVWTRRPEGGRR